VAKTHPNKGRNPLAKTGGKTSARIREIVGKKPTISTKDVLALLAKEGLKCSASLVSSVKSRMKHNRKINGNGPIQIAHLMQLKKLVQQMGVTNFTAVVRLLYGERK
jgi:hypothetical protein